MQSLACFANRHYAFAKHFSRLPFRITSREYTIFSRRQPSVESVDPRRLCYPVAEFFYNRLRRELIGLRNLFLDHGPGRTKHLSRLCNRRRLFTGPPRRTNKENGNKNNTNKDPNPKRDPKKDGVEGGVLLQKIVMLLALLLGLLMYLGRADQTQKLKEITTTSWNEFVYHMLAKGEVESVDIDSTANLVVINLHPYAVIKGKRTLFRRYLMSVPDVNNVEQKIREAEHNLGIAPGEAIPINFIRRGEHAVNAIRFLTTLLFGALVLYLFGMNSRLINPSNIFENLTKAKYTLVEPFTGKGVRFDDVAGLKNAKVEVMEFVDYLKNPTRYRSLGAKMPKGVLLLGPPGCGKTMLAKAVATESNVPFLSMNGSEFIEMLGGLGAARVRHLFREGKKRAPSIIYIDEIDAIGKKRFEAGPGGSESDRTLNQLLVEMDGMATNANVIVLASTNRDEVLDKALLRPGRFDRQITIEMPTHEERKQIFETHLKSVVLKGIPANYSDYLSSFTPGFSGADIANVCNEAALHAARYQKRMVENTDLIYAIDRVVGGMVKKTAHTPDMKKSIAYYEAGRAVVGWMSKNADPILKVSIVPRTNKKHGFTQSELSEAYLYSKEHIFDKICMLLGGRVAEHVMLNKTSVAAKDDLKRVTKLAYDQVKHYGMSTAVGLVSFVDHRGQITIKGRRPYSKRLGNLIDAEVNKIVDQAYKTTRQLLLENKEKVTAVAEALIERETLMYEDIERLIGPAVHGKKPRVVLSKLDPSTEPAAAETSA